MFTLHNKNYLCIVDYHSKFLVIKKTGDFAADSLILTCKIIFTGFGLPKKIMSDSGVNTHPGQTTKTLNMEPTQIT